MSLIEILSIGHRQSDGEWIAANLTSISGTISVLVLVADDEPAAERVSLTIESALGSVVQTRDLAAATRTFWKSDSVLILAFEIDTTAFKESTGAPLLLNGPGLILATVHPTNHSESPTRTSIDIELRNDDGVMILPTFASSTPTMASSSSKNATSQKSVQRNASVTITALPVMYSGRVIATLQLSIPGALGGPLTLTGAGRKSATWTEGDSGPRVTGLRLVGEDFEADGVTPTGIVPTVTAIDAAGRIAHLRLMNPHTAGIRLDNSSLPIDGDFVGAIRSLANELCRIIAEDPAKLRSMEWFDVERLVGGALSNLGFQVVVTPPAKDGGKDVIAKCRIDTGDQVYYIEIKHWKKRVGLSPIREFVEVNVADNTTGGLFVSTSGFTRTAYAHRAEVGRKKVRLGDASVVVTWAEHSVRAVDGFWIPDHLPDMLFANAM